MLSGFATVAGLTLLSKAISFVKDATVAREFGVRHEMDGFMLAFGLHAFIAGMLASGIPAAMLPVYADVRHRLGEAKANRLGLQSAGLHALSLVLIGFILQAFGEPIVNFMGRGFRPEVRELGRQMILDLMPFLVCYGMTTHLSMWLRGQKAFVAATASQMIIPITIILMVVLQWPTKSISVLVASTNLGAALHLIILLIAIHRGLPSVGQGWWRSLTALDPANGAILRSAGPFLVAGLVLGAATLVDQTMAGWLQAGSVTVLGYSDKVCGILLAITALAASEALFPFFADLVAQEQWTRLRKQMLNTLALVTLVSVPLTALLSWQSEWIVSVLFERGKFTADDTRRVSEVLRYAALQIPFYVVGALLSRIVVSLQAGWFTLVLAAVSLTLNVALNAVFMQTMGVAGIALSTACVYLFSAVALSIYVNRAIGLKLKDTAATEST